MTHRWRARLRLVAPAALGTDQIAAMTSNQIALAEHHSSGLADHDSGCAIEQLDLRATSAAEVAAFTLRHTSH